MSVRQLLRLTHLSIDLSHAMRAHLGSVAVPLRSLLLNSYTPVDDGILKDVDSIALWLISDQGQWPKKKLQLLIDTGRPWMARSVMPKKT